MLIKDLHINKSIDTHKRYDWLMEEISKGQGQPIVFIGETFYDKDISIGSVLKFINFLVGIEDPIYIQDVDTLSGEILDVKNDSLYKSLENDHVRLFLRLNELDFLTEDKTIISFGEEALRAEEEDPYEEDQLRVELSEELEHHKQDLMGIYITEVLDSSFTAKQKKELTSIGLDAMKRR